MVTLMTDIVDDFLTRLAQHVPDLQPDLRHQLEASLRQEWGGTKSYVAKRFGAATTAARLGANLRRQLPLKECFAQTGVSRATGYRLLGKKSR